MAGICLHNALSRFAKCLHLVDQHRLQGIAANDDRCSSVTPKTPDVAIMATTCRAKNVERGASIPKQYGKQSDNVMWIDWYNGLTKPSWTPAPSTIGLIWQLLYPIILFTFGFVFVQAIRNKLPWKVTVPFAINLVANVLFTPIQFGLRNLPLAALDIVLVWVTIVWMMVAIWKHYRWVSVAQLPYFAWVSLATLLQLSITWWNR